VKPTLHWYFDVISPFAYLQLARVRELAASQLVETVTPRPVLFAGLLKHHGQLGPAEIPSKRRFTYRYVTWRAREAGLPFRFPPAHPFNPLYLLRLCVALGATWPVVQRVFDFVWAEGRDPAGDWPALLQALQLEPEHAAQLLEDPAVKEGLRRNTDEAVSEGVFGVPTLLVPGDDGRSSELFWGADATAMALDYLHDPQAFESPRMRALEGVQEAATRRRS
jgi:2-hydroxychromene-2-carboxylate isomerase